MSYISEVIEQTEQKNADQKEFLQTVKEVLGSLAPAVEENEALYRKYCILERMVEPDRQIIFRVPWMDDKGVYHVNRGYRIQFNGAIGPYKGGLRFQPNVNLSIMKFSPSSRLSKTRLRRSQWAEARAAATSTREEKATTRLCVSANRL